MIIFLLIVCIIELVWIIGGIAIAAFLYDDKSSKDNLEKLIEMYDYDAPRDSVIALLVSLWLPMVVFAHLSKFKDWLFRK